MWLRPHKGERVPHSRRRKRRGGFPSHRHHDHVVHGHGANSAAHVEIAFQRFNRFKRNNRALFPFGLGGSLFMCCSFLLSLLPLLQALELGVLLDGPAFALREAAVLALEHLGRLLVAFQLPV